MVAFVVVERSARFLKVYDEEEVFV